MNCNRLTIRELVESHKVDKLCGYKFVKVGGEYRFNVLDGLACHLDLLDKSEHPKIVAAGEISVRKDSWTLESSFSTTPVSINPRAFSGQEVIDELTVLLGKSHLYDHER